MSSARPRAEAVADYIFDLVISCTGGSPLTGGPAPTANITVTLPVAVTSRIVATGAATFTESLLYLNEPSPRLQYPCTSAVACPYTVGGTLGSGPTDNKSVYQGILSSANSVTFLAVPVLPPGSGSLTYRIANIRAAMFQVSPATQFSATVSATGATLPLSPAAAVVANTTPGTQFSLRNAADGTSGVPPAYANAIPQNPVVGTGTTPSFLVKFAQSFLLTLTNRNTAVSVATPNPTTLDPQDTLGYRYSETGYYHPSFPTTNGLNLAGLPTQGSRLSVKFTGVPAGVSLYVATQPGPVGSIGNPGTRLIDPATGSIIASTVTISGGIPMAQLSVAGGAATAVWEVFAPFSTDPSSVAAFPVVVSYSAGVPAGTVLVQDSMEPNETGTAAASATLPVPRFRPGSTITAFTITAPATPPSITTASVPAGQEGVVHPAFSFTGTGGATPYVWSISAGALPGGIVMSAAGALSGTPTTPGVSNFTVRLTDAALQTTTAPFAMTIRPRVAITTTSVPGGVVGTAYGPFSVVGTGGLTPYVWSIFSGSLPPGLAMNASGVISGTPTTAGVSAFTVEVKDSFNQSATANLSITIAPPALVISGGFGSPTGQVGVAYPTFTFTGTGGTPPYAWSISAGALPGGITLSSAGVLSGTPTTAGVSNFTVLLADSASQTATAAYSVTIRPRVAITTTSAPGGVVGTAYGPFSVAATGGLTPYAWSILSGSLPPGLAMNASGVISGTPTTAGVFPFTAQVTDSFGQSDTAGLSITIAPPALLISGGFSSPTGQVGVVYPTFSFTGTGGTPPYVWSIGSGALPAGIVLSPAGVLSGTPTTAGVSNFTVLLADSAQQTATAAFSVTIRPRVAITTTSAPGGVVGTAYGPLSVAATGGHTPYAWSILSGSLPPGLAMNASGVISGTPTTAGVFPFTAQVTDSFSQSDTAGLSITIAPPPLVLSGGFGAPTGQVGVVYPTFSFTGTGGTPPYVWSISAGALPGGITLSSAGVLSGTPTTAGVSNFTVLLADSGQQTATAAFSVTIRPRVVITTTSAPGGVVGVAYSPFSVAATGGLPPYVWSIFSGSLPPGLATNASGVISGTPTAAGSFAFTVQVTDSFNQSDTANRSITIAPPALVIFSGFNFPDGEIGRRYGPATVPISGGTPPYVVTLIGALPGGLVINGTGTVTGTPTASGVFTFVLKVTDSGGQSALVTDSAGQSALAKDSVRRSALANNSVGQSALSNFSIIVAGAFSIPTLSIPPVSVDAPLSSALPVTGGCQPYRWTASGLPQGLSLSDSGLLTGQALSDGVYLVNLSVTDCSGATARTEVAIRISPAIAVVSPASIPDLIAGQPIPVAFAAGGGAPPYSWSVRGTLPPGVQVDAQGLLVGRPGAPGVYNFTVDVTDSQRQTANRPYALRVLPDRIADCSLAFRPAFLKFTIRQGGPTETKSVEISAICAEALALTATVELPQGRSWLTTGASVTPRPGEPALLNATASPGTLPVGTYTGTIRLVGRAVGSFPVILVVAPQFSSLDVSPKGLTFTAVENGPAPPGRVVNIVSQPSGPMSWSAAASTTSNGAWLSINAVGGATDAGTPGVSSLLARVSPAGLPAGQYYGLIEVSSPGSANGTRSVSVAFLVLPANRPLTPTPDTSGLIFTDANPRTVALANSSLANLTFTISRHTLDGAPPWFTVEAPANTIASGTELQLRIRPSLAGLGPGIRRGFLLIRYSDGTSTQIDLVLVVPRIVSPTAAKDGTRNLTGCTPARLTGVFTSLQQGFSVPVGWPSGVDMLIVDDCGEPLNSGFAIAGFSCCDGPKPLVPLRQGRWTGTWVSRAPQNSEIQLTSDFADDPQRIKGSASISGNVARTGNPPVIDDAGALNAASLSLYQPLAPGMLVNILGTRLAADSTTAQSLPLSTSLGATSVSLGGKLLPLFSVSDGSVNALMPLDAPQNTELSLIVRRGAALSAPAVVTLAPAAAGTFTTAQTGGGQAYAVDQQGRLVNSANAAPRGGVVSLFATGLGPVDREVAPGAPAPVAEPLARTTQPVDVTVGQAKALVLFSGLAPGFVGLYQVNFLIPVDAPTGDAVELVVRAGESTSNQATISIR